MDVIQLVKRLPSMQEAEQFNPSLVKTGRRVQARNPSIGEMEAGEKT